MKDCTAREGKVDMEVEMEVEYYRQCTLPACFGFHAEGSAIYQKVPVAFLRRI